MTSALFTEASTRLAATPPPAHPAGILPVAAEGRSSVCFPAGKEIQSHPPGKCCIHC